MSSDLANLEMARVVHLLRFAGPNSTVKPDNDFRSLRESHAQLRTAICEELRSARLEPQAELENVVSELVPLASELLVLNANWDHAVDERVQRIRNGTRVMHIHGTIDDPNTLYLPTEISVDVFRERAEKRTLALPSREAIDELADATQFIVYGLSLSPLDAELCNIIWSSRHDRPSLDRAVVVDLYSAAMVAGRLAMLLQPKWPMKGIWYCTPGNVVGRRMEELGRQEFAC